MVAEAVAKWGKVNFLVNNAFSFIAKGLDAERDEWHQMMDVGPIGYATMAQCVAESMQHQDGGAMSISQVFQLTLHSPIVGLTTLPKEQ